MTSATELRHQEENLAFHKNKESITQALLKNPFGLSVSQIMTICRLSVKTVKNILQHHDFISDGDIYSLRNIETKRDIIIQSDKEIITAVKAKPVSNDVVNASEEPKKPVDEHGKETTYTDLMINLFIKNPDGLTIEEILQHMNMDRTQFSGIICSIRKRYFPVAFVSRTINGRNQKVYVPNFKNAKKDIGLNPTTPRVDDPVIKLVEQDQQLVSVLHDFKAMVQTKTVITKELYLDINQVNTLLTKVFGLNKIEWEAHENSVNGVFLNNMEIEHHKIAEAV
ncbi:MAG: hypothetical protein GAK29_02190 [Acinetobacter bereziniae]|uniref:Uncharacterized protein n=1 Tax=Acinetobacter bereziniae TaxID=106648 RepID=A0A833PGP4_ACIBZ|nr:MAG: hypothetical protein GAK29_02190 [Acinetobacter bereziniae]